MQKQRRLWETDRFPGFRPGSTAQGIFGDPKARVFASASAGGKTVCGTCGYLKRGWYDRKRRWVRDLACGDYRIYLDIETRRIDCPRRMKVKQEKLDWLADNPFYSKRFAFFVGRRFRAMTIKDVAQVTHLDWKTIKELDKQYMREQLRRIGTPTPKVIGVDEIAIRRVRSQTIFGNKNRFVNSRIGTNSS